MIGNEAEGADGVTARVVDAGATEETKRPVAMTYPAQVFSLSHVAIPFPMDDELYGIQPMDAGNPRFGVSLGAIAPRGERGALMVSLDSMFRISSNPFFPYLLARIDEVIAEPARASGARPAGARRAGPAAQASFPDTDPEFDEMLRKAQDVELDSVVMP